MINYDTLAVEVANTLLEGKLSLRQVANLYGLKFEDVEVIWEELLEQFKEEDYDGNGDYDDNRD
jgi:hypothetical protein